MNQKVSGHRHSPIALVINISRLVVLLFERVGGMGGVGSTAGATPCRKHTVLQSSSQQSKRCGPGLRLHGEKNETTHIKIASSWPELSSVQPGTNCTTGPTDVAPGGSHLYALKVTLTDLIDWQREGWRVHLRSADWPLLLLLHISLNVTVCVHMMHSGTCISYVCVFMCVQHASGILKRAWKPLSSTVY